MPHTCTACPGPRMRRDWARITADSCRVDRRMRRHHSCATAGARLQIFDVCLTYIKRDCGLGQLPSSSAIAQTSRAYLARGSTRSRNRVCCRRYAGNAAAERAKRVELLVPDIYRVLLRRGVGNGNQGRRFLTLHFPTKSAVFRRFSIVPKKERSP